MKVMLIKLMTMISLSISFLKTPMSMGIMLLIQTTLSTMILSKMMVSSWMSMIMFLMLIGGLLILFMYMSSIASNEKFTPNIYMLLMMCTVILPMEEMLMEMQIHEKSDNLLLLNKESLTMSIIYNKKTMMITIMMFMYLLLAMIAVTSIIKVFKGPLRSK